ncbi:transporter [Alkalilimnicola ehrlichii]|uniref:Transporter n=1 Tax=Alkalilimnicola ehrlichii TaxID=351052 RepID=A0A3E0WHV7_9GAMM|nr:bile acid:sodium symporter [Alkalilimnicola ehrlichii]RFA25364.1 transporter [Alkalilimnicola ehrlichii]RFA32542.1 transporter [Alkalilimnicola ehrlichii]
MLQPWEQSLLNLMMIVIMLGMGASLTFKDFRLAFRQPQAILIGFASQYLFMPLIAFILARSLGLSQLHTVALVLMGCIPGGTTSNLFAYFSRSVLGLSILMTVCSTLAAVIMVPATLALYTAGIDAEFRIPSDNVAAILFVLLIPTVLGIVLRRSNANVGAVTELIGGVVGVLVILFLIGAYIPRNLDLLSTTPKEIYIAAIGLGLCGFLIGYWFSRALRLNSAKARTVSLETGIQNGPLAILIVGMTFEGTQQQEMLLIPVLYSMFIVFTSSLITIYYRARSLKEELARDQAKVEPA